MTIGIGDSLLSMRNILSKFGQGAFYGYSTAAQDILTGAGLTVVTITTEGVDVCSWFTSNTFTPKQAGYYLLFGKVNITLDADFTNGTHYLVMYIRKNGAIPAARSYSYTKGEHIIDLAIVEADGTTDYFDLAVTHNSGATVSIADVAFGGVFVSYNNP